MFCPSGHACRLALATALFGCASTAWLRGEDDDDDLVNVRGQAAPRQFGFAAGGRIMISESNINSWIYGSESRDRGWLEAALKQKIDEIGKDCDLTELQKQKLTLAGKGDIQRFESRVEDLKIAYQPGALRQEKYAELYQKARALHAVLQQRGLFRNSSLFHKTLLTVLRPEQVAHCEQVDQERRIYRYRARVEMCVAQLDAVLGLRDEQRRRIVQLVLDKTRPPRSFGQSDQFVVLVQMSRLPQDELKSLLDPSQWPEMRRRLLNAKRMMPMLKQNGVILDDGDESAKQADVGTRVLRKDQRNEPRN